MRVLRHVIEQMLSEARANPEIECCGLLAGGGGVITRMLPATNGLASAAAYEIAPEELFRLFKQMRSEGWEHLGIYHSHPRGPNIPSPADVKRAYYPNAAYFILSPAAHVTQPVRAFRIRA
ncbi:MAG: M67 family metallopeptidase, partial [Acidobacteria bacterium]|nr:M67 family metallopeptidase [Acidobacteriota bacterium]